MRPAVDFSRLEEVLVVTTPPPAITAEQIAKEAEAIAAQRRRIRRQRPQNASPQCAAPSNADATQAARPASARATERATARARRVKIAAALLAIALALALQTTLASLVIRGTAALDLVLIVVVYLSLISGPVTGVLLGSAAGLVQDALSSGIIGIGGLAKTVVGFVAGFLGHAVHRHGAALAVPGLRAGDGAARGDFHGAVHAARPAAVRRPLGRRC